MNIKQMQGLTALHACNMKEAMNGIVVRKAQFGGTSQFQTNMRVKIKTSYGIMQKAKAATIATELQTIFLLCLPSFF